MARGVSLLLSNLRVPEAVSHEAKRPRRNADCSPSLVRMLRIRGCIMQTASLWIFYFSGREGENDRNLGPPIWVDHNLHSGS